MPNSQFNTSLPQYKLLAISYLRTHSPLLTHSLPLRSSLDTFHQAVHRMMFSPDTPHSTTMYQPQTDYLLPLPSLITATDQDYPSTLTYELHHDDHQYELANYCSYSSSGCDSSPSNYSANLLPDDTYKQQSLTQRSSSVSSHSLPPQMNENNTHYMGFNNKPAVNVMNLHSTHRLVDLIDSCSVRRVFSTGDLHLQMQQYQLSQQHNGSSSTKESSSSSIIEGMLSKACRYSPEEKKERIERYKTKRSHRNFNKKIKYACRKTLADSRPRIRGRFAKNNDDDNNNEDDSVDNKWGGNGDYEADGQWESYQDDNWLDLFNAAWLHK